MTARIASIRLADPAYPAALAAIHDPPPTIWTRGCLDCLDGVLVAIVGSRAASPYALEVARRLAADLACRGVTVVSGMARGVDSAAHRGALEAGGATVAVFGSGVDVIYPREHAALAKEICERGVLMSEFPPGTPPRASHFPQRNRVISGLSRAVVVVEAAEKSGSLITANFALEQGRDVLAVPGSVLGGRNTGSHALLRDGAKIVETADDILEDLYVERAAKDEGRGTKDEGRATSDDGRGMRGEGSKSVKTASNESVLSSMTPGEPYDLDQLAGLTGLDRIKLLQRLLVLELGSAVRRVDGGRFVRFSGPSTLLRIPLNRVEGGTC
jgi:DNA processing protein